IDTINKYIINGTCNGQVLQYMTRLSKSDEWEDADRFASLFYQVIGPLSEDYKEAESTRQASIEKHDAQIKALKAEMAIHEKRIQVLIHEIPKKDKEAAALLAQEQKELEEKVFQIAEKMSAIIGLPEYQSTFRLPPHNLVVAGFLANGDNNCILQQRSFDLLEYETVDLVKNDKDGFETAVEELLQKLFMNEKITQVDLTLSARNGSDEFIHAVLVQPEQMRIYDSHVGLISYESLQELYEDLLERIAIFATDHLEVTGYAVKGAE
ncbi:MAG TPA: hypothetical protein VN457_02000, partial [Chlamydiales bacterium]|nr:hypothetical protein [Chlamydiales bacterium]